MKVLVFRSPKGKEIVFDDFVDDRKDGSNSLWVEICPKCHKKYRNLLKNKCKPDGSGVACCSVAGCDSEDAFWYVDFLPEEIMLKDGKSLGKKEVRPITETFREGDTVFFSCDDGYGALKDAKATVKGIFTGRKIVADETDPMYEIHIEDIGETVCAFHHELHR